MDNCLFCNNEFNFASIKKYDYWDLQLFVDDQYYIGRSVIVLRNRHITNISDINSAEREELFDEVLPDINNSLDSTFSPDLYNYSSLGNDCRHLHIHVIPRYENPVEFNGSTFKDEFWDQTYSQDYDRKELSEDNIEKLINLLQSNI